MTRKRVHAPTPTHADLAAPVVRLISELRPDLPLPVIASLTVQALDEGADAVLDAEWSRQRQDTYPAAVAAAHHRHVYAAQTPPASLEDIGADYMARPRPRLEIVR